ncbi:hypothetical protein L3i23_24390 [Herbiconiux sp. L3-i23]|nr:hypothetical protein L3i23_24390 [Herbiconiux sp. L3-i23]
MEADAPPDPFADPEVVPLGAPPLGAAPFEVPLLGAEVFVGEGLGVVDPDGDGLGEGTAGWLGDGSGSEGCGAGSLGSAGAGATAGSVGVDVHSVVAGSHSTACTAPAPPRSAPKASAPAAAATANERTRTRINPTRRTSDRTIHSREGCPSFPLSQDDTRGARELPGHLEDARRARRETASAETDVASRPP